MDSGRKRITLAKIESGEVVEQALFWNDEQTPDGELWLPIVVETPDYNRVTHTETGRGNRVEADRVVRYRIIEPIEVTTALINEECRRRIMEHIGASDMTDALVKQINNPGVYTDEIARLRECAMVLKTALPIEFRDDKFWL